MSGMTDQVLIVDHSLTVRMNLRDAFRVADFDTAECATAAEARAAIARLRHLPVVIFTSSDTEDDIERGYTLGVNSYVRKPVEPETFKSTVGMLGRYWLTLNEFERNPS